MSSMSVFNSAAAPLLQEYDTAKKGSELADKYISQLQTEDSFPAQLLTALVDTKEKYQNQLLEIKQRIMQQTSDEPLDAFDRGVFQSLSQSTQGDLESVFAADEVYQRAMEMRAEQTAGGVGEAAMPGDMPGESLSQTSESMGDIPADIPAGDMGAEAPLEEV